MPRGVYSHICTLFYAHTLYSVFVVAMGELCVMITYPRGVLRCSFLTFGHTRASSREASDKAELHAFFMSIYEKLTYQ